MPAKAKAQQRGNAMENRDEYLMVEVDTASV
jgi:hypothetical protein